MVAYKMRPSTVDAILVKPLSARLGSGGGRSVSVGDNCQTVDTCIAT